MNADFVRSIVVRISDDSPEDGEGGALLSRWRIFVDGVEHTGDIVPVVEGGIRRGGAIVASGTDVITLTYNIEDFSPSTEDAIDDFREIERIEIGLVLANDYKVEVTSNKQTNNLGTPVFLPVLPRGWQRQGRLEPSLSPLQLRPADRDPHVGLLTSPLPTCKALTSAASSSATFSTVAFPMRTWPRTRRWRPTRPKPCTRPRRSATIPIRFSPRFSASTRITPPAPLCPTPRETCITINEQRHLYEFVDDNDDQDELPDWTRRTFGSRVNTRQGQQLLTDARGLPGH